MNTVIIIIILMAAIIFPFILVRRINKNQLRRMQEIKDNDLRYASRLRNSIETTANVISKNQVITPNAGGFAKVDLQVELQFPGKNLYQAKTCWLVEVNSLDQVEPGKTIQVKVNPKKPLRIYPDVTWAQPWIFGS
jgi:hypothetical protein